jgi:hypothetical protein
VDLETRQHNLHTHLTPGPAVGFFVHIPCLLLLVSVMLKYEERAKVHVYRRVVFTEVVLHVTATKEKYTRSVFT